MALKRAVDRATFAQLCLGAGITTFLLAMTYRRLKEEEGLLHKPSKRSKALSGKATPVHILEHLKRLDDPDYVCLSIAENKLTVGMLVEKLIELAARPLQHQEQQQQHQEHNNQEQGRVDRDDNSTSSMNTARNSDATSTASANSPKGEKAVTTPLEIGDNGGQQGDSTSATAASSTSSAATDDVAKAQVASMGYGDPRGPLWVRHELAEMMGEQMFHRKIDPDNLVIAAGLISVLRLLMVVITEQGQGCLIPAPYFAGFDKALTAAGVRAWSVDGASGGGGVEGGVDAAISPRALQSSLKAARAADVIIRVLLITSPHNPTGRLYTPKALLRAIKWARKRGLHVAVDEVYANCVHRPNASFRSVGNLLANRPGMRNDVHIMYGLSKDLGVAGWRVGVLYSENKDVVATMSKLIFSSQASSDTMNTVGQLFQEPGFMEEYFRQHQEGLRAAYTSLANNLGRRGIMHVQAEAGLFVMLDLREFLEDSTKEGEARLWRQMVDRTGVNLTPGEAFKCTEPGWFRLCFAYQEVHVVSRCVDRLGDFFQELLQERAVKRDEEQRLAAIAAAAAASGGSLVIQPPRPTQALQGPPQKQSSSGTMGGDADDVCKKPSKKKDMAASVPATVGDSIATSTPASFAAVPHAHDDRVEVRSRGGPIPGNSSREEGEVVPAGLDGVGGPRVDLAVATVVDDETARDVGQDIPEIVSASSVVDTIPW